MSESAVVQTFDRATEIGCLAQFFVEFHDTLMADSSAVVDWRIQEDGSRFCFRVALPYLSATDMIGSPDEPVLTPGEPLLVADSEHLCPITYLTFKKGLGCYDVSQADRAATRLGLPDSIRDTIITAADRPEATGGSGNLNSPETLLYWQFHGLFEQKEQQILVYSIEVQHPEGKIPDLGEIRALSAKIQENQEISAQNSKVSSVNR